LGAHLHESTNSTDGELQTCQKTCETEGKESNVEDDRDGDEEREGWVLVDQL